MELPISAEYTKLHDYFKNFAESHMNRRTETNKNLELELRYPEMYDGKEGKVDYQLQLSNPMKEGAKDQIKVIEDG